MAPPHKPPDLWEHEYAIRKLTEGMETLHEQAAVNAEDTRKNREALIEIKAKIAMVAGLVGAAAATAVSAAMKLLLK